MLQSMLALFLASCLLGRLDCTELTVNQGADATLECSGRKDATEIMLRWQRHDLQSEGHVFYFKDGRFHVELQHDLFKGRVELKDPNWKETGDFSVILQHVTMNDAGTYECYAGYDGQEPELLSNITLKVEKPGQTDELNKDGGNKGEGKEEVGNMIGSALVVVGVVVGVLLLIAVGFVIYRKKCRNTNAQQNVYKLAPQKEGPAEDAPQPEGPAEDAPQPEGPAEDAPLAEKADEHADMNSDSHQPPTI